ncbi:hypothetical protein DPMN_020181 [Dreissena polymorpha]|uniref:Uncharacterized protein n=1 Tax=Dreissena polymorpha TaxID=45954 RepID=A0A9D4S9Z2_DREPO|nr:hypothetical protein DPMN_020181 [Dreissena polymorpha]
MARLGTDHALAGHRRRLLDRTLSLTRLIGLTFRKGACICIVRCQKTAPGWWQEWHSVPKIECRMYPAL